MNILYVPTKDPRLTNGGNEQRTNLLWESLKRHGKVYTFVSDQTMDTSSLMIEGEHPIYKFRPKIKKSIIWHIVCAILSWLSPICIFKRKLLLYPNPKQVFNGVAFDIVVTRYVHPLCNYKYWEIAPLLIDVDDHPQQVFTTVKSNQLPMGLKKIGEVITRLQTKIIINKSVGGWIANEEQISLCKQDYYYLPNIPQRPSNKYNYDYKERKNLFTVGAMGYQPNKNGVNSFLKNIWPLFHEKYPNVIYFIIGKGATEQEAKEWNSVDGVNYLGFVDNLESLYEKIFATVVPIYSGGGTCIKTLEAMSFSRICFSTKFGLRGLPSEIVENEEGVVLFNNIDDFIDGYKKVQIISVRSELEKKGREYISEHYSKDCFDGAVDIMFERLN